MENFATTKSLSPSYMFERLLATPIVTYLERNVCAIESNFCLSFILKNSFNLIPRGLWFASYKRQKALNIIPLVFSYIIILIFMIKHEQNTGTLSQNLRHSIYFRQWNQMQQLH